MVRPLTSEPHTIPVPLRPAEHAESVLISAILDGTHPAGSDLPAERVLATSIGVTRPTLREALKKLERDGWISIQHGKPTRVADVFEEGGLNILGSLVRHPGALPPGFVEKLLEVRLAMAPAYTALAVARAPRDLASFLGGAPSLTDEPEAFAAFDWRLHLRLTKLSGNFVFRLILNGFQGFYEELARLYFAPEAARMESRNYYEELSATCLAAAPQAAEQLTRRVMARSLDLWKSSGGREVRA